MLSKPSTLLALTVLAALSVEIGCGEGSHKTSSRHTLAPVGAKGTPGATKPDANGMVTRTVLNDDGTVKIGSDGKPVTEKIPAAKANEPQKDSRGNPIMPKMNTPKADANLDNVDKMEKSLSSGKPVPREKLDAGTYELQTSETIAKISGGGVGEVTKAYLRSQLVSLGNGQYRIDSDRSTAISAGWITNYTGADREIDFPASFKVDLSGGAWNPNRDAAVNLTLWDSIKIVSGKAELSADLRSPKYTPSSFWNLIANGTLQNDGSYRYDDGGKPIYLRLLKEANKLVVFMSFEEQRDTGGASKITADREVFFTYKVTADTAKPAARDSSNKDLDDEPHINDIDSSANSAAGGMDI